jgi:hypothetical protein
MLKMFYKKIVVVALNSNPDVIDRLPLIFDKHLLGTYVPEIEPLVIVAVISVPYNRSVSFSDFIIETRAEMSQYFDTKKIFISVVD